MKIEDLYKIITERVNTKKKMICFVVSKRFELIINLK